MQAITDIKLSPEGVLLLTAIGLLAKATGKTAEEVFEDIKKQAVDTLKQVNEALK